MKTLKKSIYEPKKYSAFSLFDQINPFGKPILDIMVKLMC